MTQRRVALYARQSSTEPDEMEASGSIEDQRTALTELAERRGWTVTGIYEDPDAPANRLDRRHRWVDLLIDAQAGEFDVVAAFDTSRLWRSVEFKLHTCKTLAAAGVATVATLGGDVPTDATDDPEGGFISTVLAAVGEYDNQMRALKVRKAHARAAKEGVPWKGKRPFGWTQGRTEIIEAEKELILEAYERVVERKESTNEIAKDWNERGFTTSRGNEWERGPLIKMLRSPSLAGWRTHGKGDDQRRYKGQWEPILTPEQHERLVDELARRRHRSGGRGTPRLLSSNGLLRCGICGERMVSAAKTGGYRIYRCPPQRPQACRKIVVGAELVEDEVVGRVLASLNADLVSKYVEAAASADEQVAQASKALAGIEDRRKMIGRVLIKEGDEVAARAALDELEQIERDARRHLDRASIGIDLLIEVAANPQRWWKGADFLDQRRLLEIVCEQVVVHPSKGQSFEWDPERVEIAWRV